MLCLVCVAAALIGFERAWVALHQPLWFDESWTAAVAATPDWKSFFGEIYNDVNAPLYYGLMRLWVMLAGHSDFALRAPGLAAVVAAGAVPLLVPVKGLSFEARLTWGAMVFGWWGVGIFLDGRCYGLLLALSTVQCVLLARLLTAPSRARAWAWCAVAAASILLQYYALIAVAAQGLVYLAARPRQALRTWPAVLAFVPAFGWMAFHAPRLRAFANLDVAWHPLVDPMQAFLYTAFAVNPATLFALPAVAAVLVSGQFARRAPADTVGESPRGDAVLWLIAGASLAGFILALISGALRPSLTGRYLIPEIPGLMLGLVLLARRSAHARLIYALLLVIYLGVALRPGAVGETLRHRAPYGYEVASATLMKHGVTDVVYVWDHEATPIMAPASLQRVGAVFFRRAGNDARVTPLAFRPGEDVNRLALAAASGPRPGIIWIYNRRGATSAHRFPPQIPELDRRWSCERIGDAAIGNLACWRAP
jgi:hypothetical protein